MLERTRLNPLLMKLTDSRYMTTSMAPPPSFIPNKQKEESDEIQGFMFSVVSIQYREKLRDDMV